MQYNTTVRILKFSFIKYVLRNISKGIISNCILLLHTTGPTKMATEVEDNLTWKSEI